MQWCNHCSLNLLDLSNPPTSASRVRGYRYMPPHPANFCIFCTEGFHHVAQAGLALLSSSDLTTSASQSVGIQAWATVTSPDFKRQNCFKTYMNDKGTWIAKAMFIKINTVGEISLYDFKIYYTAIVIKIVWYWQNDRHWQMEHNSNPRNRPIHICPTDVWQKSKSNSVEERWSFQ